MSANIEIMKPHTIPLTAIVLGSPVMISPSRRSAITPRVMQKQLTAMNEYAFVAFFILSSGSTSAASSRYPLTTS